MYRLCINDLRLRLGVQAADLTEGFKMELGSQPAVQLRLSPRHNCDLYPELSAIASHC
jgi:hypothetical protein